MPISLQNMFAPQKDSPVTVTVGEITASDTSVVVQSAAILPQEPPYPLTLGVDKGVTETVLVTAINGNQLTIQRGYYGQALAWIAGTKVARVLNAADIAALQENVGTLRSGLVQETKDRKSAVTAEQSARQQVDEELLGLLDAESERAKGAEAALGEGIQALDSGIAAESEARQTADAGLLNAITAETGRATGAEAALEQAIADEQTRAKGAEATIQSTVFTHAGMNINASGGTHGLRYYNNKLQRISANGVTWEDIKTGVSFVYECTGTADNIAIQSIIHNFYRNTTAMSMKLIITGTMGIEPQEEGVAIIAIENGNPRGAVCFVDFSDCTIPKITGTDDTFLEVLGYGVIYVFGLKIDIAGVGLYVHSSRSHFDSCNITCAASWIDGTESRFVNCSFKCISPHNMLYVTGHDHNFRDCSFETTGILSVHSAHTSFDNCYVNGMINLVGAKNSFTRCYMAGFQDILNVTGPDNRLAECYINGGMYGVIISSYMSGIIRLTGCKIIAHGTGISVLTANTDAEVKLVGCAVRGNIHDVQQGSAASTVKWFIEGNSFSCMGITVDGAAEIPYKTNAHIYFPMYANQFYRNISN